MTYSEYLLTDHWRRMRERILERDNRQCVECTETENLHVHHLTYERVGCELDTDLITLCELCHAIEHQLRPVGKKERQLREIERDIKALMFGRLAGVDVGEVLGRKVREYEALGGIA